MDDSWKNKGDVWCIETWENIKNDKYFMDLIQRLIQPIKPCALVEPPKDFLTIALHIRKGNHNDFRLKSQQFYDISNLNLKNAKDSSLQIFKKNNYSDCHWPLIFVPDQYYIECLKKISNYFKNINIYVHIFTDYKDPVQLMNKYREKLNLPNIMFNTNRIENSWNLNFLEDFFSMQKFDCLIRSKSTFSQMVELLGNFQITCSPKHASWIDDILFVDNIAFICKKKDLFSINEEKKVAE